MPPKDQTKDALVDICRGRGRGRWCARFPPERKRGRMRERERGTLLPSVCDRLKLIPPSSGYTHAHTCRLISLWRTYITTSSWQVVTRRGVRHAWQSPAGNLAKTHTHTHSKWFILQYTFDNTTLCLCPINISHILLIVVLWDESLNI